jgi:AcrR family transcriptional regulator
LSAGSFASAARDLLRERALDAVGTGLARGPWSEVTMAEVAAGAGVSRQTIYNEFGSREALAQAYVLREVDRFTTAVEGAVRDNAGDPRAAVAAAFDVFLDAVADHPIVRHKDELLPLVATDGGVLERATDQLAALMATHWPDVAHDEARLVADVVVRLAISHAALPSGPSDLTAAKVARVLGPYLDALVGDAARAPGPPAPRGPAAPR